jgi:DNA-directed RNA polymerase specialized sigma24 family protein
MGDEGGTPSREDPLIHTADLALARRVAAAERPAFDALFERYADRVHAFAHRRAAAPESGQELTEQMLERVFNDIGHYGGDVSLDEWVLGRCRRVLADLRMDSEDLPRGTGQLERDSRVSTS